MRYVLWIQFQAWSNWNGEEKDKHCHLMLTSVFGPFSCKVFTNSQRRAIYKMFPVCHSSAVWVPVPHRVSLSLIQVQQNCHSVSPSCYFNCASVNKFHCSASLSIVSPSSPCLHTCSKIKIKKKSQSNRWKSNLIKRVNGVHYLSVHLHHTVTGQRAWHTHTHTFHTAYTCLPSNLILYVYRERYLSIDRSIDII